MGISGQEREKEYFPIIKSVCPLPLCWMAQVSVINLNLTRMKGSDIPSSYDNLTSYCLSAELQWLSVCVLLIHGKRKAMWLLLKLLHFEKSLKDVYVHLKIKRQSLYIVPKKQKSVLCVNMMCVYIIQILQLLYMYVYI